MLSTNMLKKMASVLNKHNKNLYVTYAILKEL